MSIFYSRCGGELLSGKYNRYDAYIMRPVFFLFLIIILLVSCEPAKLSSEEIPIPAVQCHTVDSSYLFELLYADDTRLVASLLSSSNQLMTIPVHDSTLVFERHKDFLRKGRSESEVLHAHYKIRQDTIHVVSFTGTGIDKIIKIPFSGIADCASWKTVSTPLYQGLFFGMNFDIIDDDIYVFAGGKADDESVVCYVDNKDFDIKRLDYVPQDKNDCNVVVKHIVYTSESKVFVNGENLLFVCGKGRLALIINRVNGSARYLWDEYPVYSTASDGINYRLKSKSHLGFNIYTSGSKIYLSPILARLVNGVYDPGDYNGYPPYFTDRIDVFSWEGDKLYTLRLEYPSSSFVINEGGDRLYAFIRRSKYWESGCLCV